MTAQHVPPSQPGRGYLQGAWLQAQPPPGHVWLPPIHKRILMTKYQEIQWLLSLVFSSGKTCAVLPRLHRDSRRGRRSPIPLCASSQALGGHPPSQPVPGGWREQREDPRALSLSPWMSLQSLFLLLSGERAEQSVGSLPRGHQDVLSLLGPKEG